MKKLQNRNEVLVPLTIHNCSLILSNLRSSINHDRIVCYFLLELKVSKILDKANPYLPIRKISRFFFKRVAYEKDPQHPKDLKTIFEHESPFLQ